MSRFKTGDLLIKKYSIPKTADKNAIVGACIVLLILDDTQYDYDVFILESYCFPSIRMDQRNIKSTRAWIDSNYEPL